MYFVEERRGRSTRAETTIANAEYKTKVCDRHVDHGLIRSSGFGGQKTILRAVNAHVRVEHKRVTTCYVVSS